MHPGLFPSEGLTGPGGSSPEVVHSHGGHGAADWRWHPCPSTGQQESSHIMAAGFPQSKRSRRKKL